MTSILKVDTIQNSTGTDALSIGADGSVGLKGLSYRPAFNAYLGANLAGDYRNLTKVAIDTERFDIGGHFDTTANTFTAPVDGLYQFNYVLMVNGTETLSWLSSYIIVNSVNATDDLDYRTLTDPTNGDYATITSCAVMQLSASDIVYPAVQNYTDSTTTLRRGSTFSGYLIG